MKGFDVCLCVGLLLAFFNVLTALPRNLQLRSTEHVNTQDKKTHVVNKRSWIDTPHITDHILCDLMMMVGDRDGDEKLSSVEIRDFYRNAVDYHIDVATTYGHSFIEIADVNGDGLLDRDELLPMIVALDARKNTR